MTMDAVAPGFLGARGVAMYRRSFTQNSTRARLQLNACGFYCRIWVGDAGRWTEVGDHQAGGYVGFWLDLPNAPAPSVERELVVLSDNRFNKTTAPLHTGGDFWHYGGLMRSVLLHELPEQELPFVWRAYVLPTKDGYREGIVNVTVIWTNSSFSGTAPLSLTFDDASAPSFAGHVSVLAGVSKLQATVPSPRLWTTTDPQLHTVRVLGQDDDTGATTAGVVERFGLRWWDVDTTSCNFMEGKVVGTDSIAIVNKASKEECCNACSSNSKCVAFTFEPDGQCYLKDNAEQGFPRAGAVSGLQTARLSLNGEVLKLHGWNHHTQWPETGASPTDQQLDDDLQQMQAAGTNYIRGAHYPQDQRWLDRLDEQGIAMWEETLGPGVSVANLQDTNGFMKHQLQQLDEMMDLSMNHASIMTWGWFNEGPTNDEAACIGYKACSEHAQARDPTRFRTWADSRGSGAKCFDFASLVSLNSYPGWYGGVGDLSAPARHWNLEAKAVATKHPGKPFVISETGAGGIFEWDANATDEQWTQRYQVEIIERDVDVALGNGQISGITLWHYFDFKGNDAATQKCGHCDYLPDVYPPTCSFIDVSCNRPGGENHKGVVDFWRREKQVYSVIASKYNASILETSTRFAHSVVV